MKKLLLALMVMVVGCGGRGPGLGTAPLPPTTAAPTTTTTSTTIVAPTTTSTSTTSTTVTTVYIPPRTVYIAPPPTYPLFLTCESQVLPLINQANGSDASAGGFYHTFTVTEACGTMARPTSISLWQWYECAIPTYAEYRSQMGMAPAHSDLVRICGPGPTLSTF